MSTHLPDNVETYCYSVWKVRLKKKSRTSYVSLNSEAHAKDAHTEKKQFYTL
jgi:hypothetical protein